jgi:hypothetical protein
MYSSLIIVFVVVVIGVPAFFIFYKAPTCSDGVQNGDEIGVDCGGSCQRLCQSAFLVPNVSWSRLENLAPGLYNVATYIVNPNTKAVALNVPYHVILYDSKGVQIIEYAGTVTLPPHRNTLAFNAAVNTDKRIPAKVFFEFTQAPNWQSATDQLSAITIGDKNYSEDNSGASLTVTINNSGLNQIGPTSVYAILFDKDGNAIGFSKTRIDGISALGSVSAPFTWPTSFNGKVISIEVLPVAE